METFILYLQKMSDFLKLPTENMLNGSPKNVTVRWMKSSEYEKLYIFFCIDSVVKIISFDPPIFTRVSSKEEFYESIKERVCWYPKEETDEQS